MTTVKDSLLLQYENAWRHHFHHDQKDWLARLREQQFKTFLHQGFPNIRDEHWKYTNLSAFNSQLFEFALPSSKIVSQQNVEHLFLKDSHFRLVFVDGFFAEHLSKMPSQEKYIISNLAHAIKEHSDLVQKYLTAGQNSSAFLNFNTACVQDGVFIYVPSDCVIDKPIHLLFLASTNCERKLQNIRNVIAINEKAKITLFEEHQSLNQNTYMTNIVTQIYAGPSSQIEFIKLQNQNNLSLHVANNEIVQSDTSCVSVHWYGLGSQLARDDIHSYLKEKGAELQFRGLYLPFQKQHIDLHTFIHHQSDQTTSEELVKGVVAGKSRAVFNGKIIVNKNVKQAIANLQNKNLLLARDAEVNTKPELEIYSKDVKCRHGATIGRVDKEMLFYLQSRGIPYEKAQQLLLLAFVREHLTAICDTDLAEKLLDAVTINCEEVIK